VKTVAPPALVPPLDLDDPSRRPGPPPWVEFARAPLVPVALAATAGLVADRYLTVPLDVGFVVAAVGLAGWVVARSRSSSAALALLWMAFAGLAAARHHTYRHSFAPDDVGEFALAEPSLVRVRGVLAEEPVARFAPKSDPLEPANRPDRDSAVLWVTALAGRDSWRPASGLARLSVERMPESIGRPALGGLRAGDSVELVGMLSRPRPPGNPGERDYADDLLDRRIRAEVRVSDAAAAVSRLDSGEWTGEGILAALRRRASAALIDHLPPREAATAVALLLGDGSAMDRAEWDAYVRTGVVHALAISGQHLAVLAGFLWIGLRVWGVRRTRGAWVVLVVVVGYTVLTGMRPSGVRAMVMVAAVCGALVLRRPVSPANVFALAWLVVLAVNPADPFTLGCQLSFVSVFALVWGVGRWVRPRPLTPLEQLIDESRPVSVRLLRAAGRVVLAAYAISLVIAAVNAPLLIADQNLVSPVGVLIGPPVVVLTSVALVAGFLLMLLSPFGPLAVPFAVLTRWSLAGCEVIVGTADELPGGSVYVPGVPVWWLVAFYLGVAGVVLLGPPWRSRFAVGLIVWVLFGLALPPRFGPSDELRVTVLSVGHGGCMVIETPDGRCLVYDTGSMAGPGVVRRVVAPYLWSRGVRRVDELFLSHADADHFNGVGELLRRFPVGQVTLTPSFAEKPAADVAAALTVLERHKVPRRVAVAGDRFTAGDVEFEVLHPPPVGPPGVENERSLVLHLRHAGHTILLTGDLEKSGTWLVLDQPARKSDVLMAPHHGSRAAFPKKLVEWADPRLVVVSRGTGFGSPIQAGAAGPDVPIWDTVSAGAITLRSHRSGLVAEAFRTGERRVLVRGGP
jgi:competence protein ComEC